MSRVVLPFAAVLITFATCCGAEQSLLARVTVYWRGESQPWASWNGMRLRPGHCAVDPKKIPYGSTVTVDGEELIAVDTGPSVISRKAARISGRTVVERNAVVVDRYCETKALARAWEKSHPHFMMVRVAPPQQRLAMRSGEMSKTRPVTTTGVTTATVTTTPVSTAPVTTTPASTMSLAHAGQCPRFIPPSQNQAQLWAAASQLMRWGRRRT